MVAGEDGGGGGGGGEDSRVKEAEIHVDGVKEGGGGALDSPAEEADIHGKGSKDGGGRGAEGEADEEVVEVIGDGRDDEVLDEEDDATEKEVDSDGKGSKDRGGDVEEERDANVVLPQQDDATVLQRLKALCDVLGSNYKEKLDEVGLASGSEITEVIRSKLTTVVSFLEKVKLDRFVDIKNSAAELMSVWRKSEQPIERLLKVNPIFYILRAQSADDINEEKYLSASLLRTIVKETESIKSADLALMKEKYQRNKKKLSQLMKDLRFTSADIDFDTKKKFDAVNYPENMKKLKWLIKELRKDRLERMLLVLKMEMLEIRKKEKASAEELKGFVDHVKAHVEQTSVEGEICKYNGRNVLDILKEVEEKLTPRQVDIGESDERSVRLARRLQKKDMSVPTVQEAAVVSLIFQKKCRSGTGPKHAEVPTSKVAEGTKEAASRVDEGEAGAASAPRVEEGEAHDASAPRVKEGEAEELAPV